jgi:hypothetical protein
METPFLRQLIRAHQASIVNRSVKAAKLPDSETPIQLPYRPVNFANGKRILNA